MFRSPKTLLDSRFNVASRPSSTRLVSPARTLALLTLCAASLAVSSPSRADTKLQNGSATTFMPGGVVAQHGLRTAIVSATVSEGDTDNAQRALIAAQRAIASTRDFYAIPTAQVAAALKQLTTKGGTDLRLPEDRRKLTPLSTPYGEPQPVEDIRSPLDAQDFRALGKKLKVDRLLAVYITPGESNETSSTFGAVVEMFDPARGNLVGRGEATFTATLDAAATDAPLGAKTISRPAIPASDKAAENISSDVPVANGTARLAAKTTMALPIRALGGAVFRAVQELNRPISLSGRVISIPGAYQARVSLSELKGLRNGARIEFLEGGQPVAYGTVSSVGSGEALVTVAPEYAFPSVYVNMKVRNVNNPTIVRAGMTDDQRDEKEFRRFETEFGIDLAVAGLLYLAVG